MPPTAGQRLHKNKKSVLNSMEEILMTMKGLFLIAFVLFTQSMAAAQEHREVSPNYNSHKPFGDIRWYAPGAHGDFDLYLPVAGRLGVNLVYDNQHQDILIGGGPSWSVHGSANHRLVATFCVLTDRGRQSHSYRDLFGAVKGHADGVAGHWGYVVKFSILGNFLQKELARWGVDEAEISRNVLKIKGFHIGLFGFGRTQFRGEYGGAGFVDAGGGISMQLGHGFRVHGGYLAAVNQPHEYLDHHHGEKRKGAIFVTLSFNFKEDTQKEGH